MYRTLLQHEWQMLKRSSVAWLSLVLIPVLIGLALYQGHQKVAQMRTLQAAMEVESAENLAKMVRDVEKQIRTGVVEAGHNDPGSPSNAGRSMRSNYAFLTPAPLALLSVGQSDILPVYRRVTASHTQSLYHAEEIHNPLLLAMGHYDYAFFLVYLLPLFVIAWQYDCVAREHEQGTMALLAVYGAGISNLIWVRFLWLNAVLFAWVAGVTLIGFAWLGEPIFSSDSLALLLTVGAYQLFWSGVAFAINAYRGHAARHAAALIAFWLVLVFIAPSFIHAIATAFAPVPSRLHLINEQREAAMAATYEGSKLLARYIDDHPELVSNKKDVDLEKMDAARFATIAAVERAGAPFLELFEKQRTRQFTISRSLRFLSPAFMVREDLNDLAGMGDARFVAYGESVEAYREALFQFFSRKAFKGERMTPEDFDRIPAFDATVVAPQVPAGQLATNAVFLYALGMGGLLLTLKRLRKRANLA